MDWTAIGALGELLGAAGVILSLLYLGRQIRNAAVQDQRARYEAALDQASAWTQAIHQSGDVAELTLRGLRGGPESLNSEEHFRFYSGMLSMFRSYERMVEYASERGVPEWGKDAFDHAFKGLLAFPGAQRYWADRRDWFSPSTQASITALLVEATPIMVSSYGQPDELDAAAGSE